MYSIAQNPNRKNFNNVEFLWYRFLRLKDNEQICSKQNFKQKISQAKDIARKAFNYIAKRPQHQYFFKSLSILFFNKKDSAFVLPKLLAIAKNMDDKNCFYACENIHDLNRIHWILKDERRSYINEEQFVELLIDIAQHPNHFYRSDAAILLKLMFGKMKN